MKDIKEKMSRRLAKTKVVKEIEEAQQELETKAKKVSEDLKTSISFEVSKGKELVKEEDTAEEIEEVEMPEISEPEKILKKGLFNNHKFMIKSGANIEKEINETIVKCKKRGLQKVKKVKCVI